MMNLYKPNYDKQNSSSAELGQQMKDRDYKTLGTSIIYSPLSPFALGITNFMIKLPFN